MTHINAYYQDVEDAKLKVEQAKGELEAAEVRLKSHPDYKVPKEEVKKAPKAKKSSTPTPVSTSTGSFSGTTVTVSHSLPKPKK